MNVDFEKLARYIVGIDTSSGEDLLYSLELTKSSLTTAEESMKRKMQDSMNQHDFDSMQTVLEKDKELIKVLESIEKCINAIIPELEIMDSNNFIPEERYGEQSDYSPVDYSLYNVDREEEHLLNEDFTYKKICAFKIEGKKYPINNWQDGIVKLCQLMVEKDRRKFYSLMSMDVFHGRVNSLFSTNHVEGRNRIVPETDVYVWINNSANTIAKYMLKILEQFGYNEDDIVIYLRSDYSPMHR